MDEYEDYIKTRYSNVMKKNLLSGALVLIASVLGHCLSSTFYLNLCPVQKKANNIKSYDCLPIAAKSM